MKNSEQLYPLFDRLIAAIGGMPLVIHKILAVVLGISAGFWVLSLRRIVRRNLAFAYPQWSRQQIRSHIPEIFQNFFRTIFEICRLPLMTEKEILDSVRIVGKEHIDAAVTNPNGVIIISAHIGNWEISPMLMKLVLGKTMTSVVRPLDNAWVDRWITNLRTQFGNRIISKEGALQEMTRTLRNGGVLGILIDQVTKRVDGLEVRFFGKRVMATPGAALLALRCRSTVLPAFCVRENGGLVVHVRPPLEIKRSGDLRKDIQVNTQLMNDAIVEIIKEYSSQWFWFHKRWKRFHPDLYPEYQAKRRRKRRKELRTLQKAGVTIEDPEGFVKYL
jgi:KDO2-lipid IV(A) lauroyltransferase